MKHDDHDLIGLLKKFELVNKDVINLSRRLFEMKAETLLVKQKIKSLSAR